MPPPPESRGAAGGGGTEMTVGAVVGAGADGRTDATAVGETVGAPLASGVGVDTPGGSVATTAGVGTATLVSATFPLPPPPRVISTTSRSAASRIAAMMSGQRWRRCLAMGDVAVSGAEGGASITMHLRMHEQCQDGAIAEGCGLPRRDNHTR